MRDEEKPERSGIIIHDRSRIRDRGEGAFEVPAAAKWAFPYPLQAKDDTIKHVE